MLSEKEPRAEYDLPTAVTFLFGGLAIGWILALLLSPLTKNSAPHRTPRPAGSGKLTTSTTSVA